MNKIGIFVDTCDLYHKIQRNFGQGSKICFNNYLIDIDDGELIMAFAYGMRSESLGFPKYLQSLGFTTKFKPPRIYNIGDRQIKKCDWNITMVIDIIKACTEKKLDTVILGSSNGLLLPLISYLRDQGITVLVKASGIPDSLNSAANSVFEFSEEHLETEGNDTERISKQSESFCPTYSNIHGSD